MRIAKWLVVIVALSGFGGFIADFLAPEPAAQHIFNPAWPPHAKFHDAQVILMGVGNAIVALALLFAAGSLSLQRFFLAAVISGMYWFGAILGTLLPGTDWTDPEFVNSWPYPLGLHPQQLGGWIMIGCLIAASAFALRDKRE